MTFSPDIFQSRQFAQQTLFDVHREFNYSTGQQENVLGSPWTEGYAGTGGVPTAYSTKDQPRTAPAPEIGALSSRHVRLPAAPAGGNQRQKTDYGVGPGFPRNSQNGGKQGFLFAHEAPARDQNIRQHIGYATHFDDKSSSRVVLPSGRHFSKPMPAGSPVSDYGDRPVRSYDTRVAAGSLTGRFDPDVALYHGTKKKLKGDQIIPGKYKAGDQIGQKKGLAHNGRRVNAYVTPDRELAEGYTKTARGKAGKVPKVYQVKPTGPVSADLEYLSPVSPHERVDAVRSGDLPAYKSPRPFNVVSEVQF